MSAPVTTPRRTLATHPGSWLGVAAATGLLALVAGPALAGSLAATPATPTMPATPATATLTTVSSVSSSDGDTDSVTLPSDSLLYQHLDTLCTRLPQLSTRAEELGERWHGDADTVGSAAALQERIAQAEQDGRDAAARRLQNRLERRQDAAEAAPQRLARLDALQAECTSYALGN